MFFPLSTINASPDRYERPRAEDDRMNPETERKAPPRMDWPTRRRRRWTGSLDLAEKIIRRAVAAQVDNPVQWTDQGASRPASE